MAERLERVRELTGYGDQSLRAFWKELAFDAEQDRGYGSYAAARVYHYGKDQQGRERDAPREYLQRVCERFPQIRPEWLLFGRGEPTDAHQLEKGDTVGSPAWRAARTARLDDAFDRGTRTVLTPRGSPARAVLMRLWRIRRSRGGIKITERQEELLMEEIGRAVRAPLDALRTTGLEQSEVDDYLVGMAAMLAAIARKQGRKHERNFGPI